MAGSPLGKAFPKVACPGGAQARGGGGGGEVLDQRDGSAGLFSSRRPTVSTGSQPVPLGLAEDQGSPEAGCGDPGVALEGLRAGSSFRGRPLGRRRAAAQPSLGAKGDRRRPAHGPPTPGAPGRFRVCGRGAQAGVTKRRHRPPSSRRAPLLPAPRLPPASSSSSSSSSSAVSLPRREALWLSSAAPPPAPPPPPSRAPRAPRSLPRAPPRPPRRRKDEKGYQREAPSGGGAPGPGANPPNSLQRRAASRRPAPPGRPGPARPASCVRRTPGGPTGRVGPGPARRAGV
uniref:basic proline-rich protein-like n=1 Tax=Jaculus jaculus TaxID=51337 RepID=UPI001E1B0D71|nr:basic proline-rich protein-like [Jaculus jaculus]